MLTLEERREIEAGLTRDIENELARLRVELGDRGVLPEPVHAARHRVVHQIVFRRHRRKYGAHAPRFFSARHLLEPEGGRIFSHVRTIAAAPKRGYIRHPWFPS